jgi:hypothetical protein
MICVASIILSSFLNILTYSNVMTSMHQMKSFFRRFLRPFYIIIIMYILRHLNAISPFFSLPGYNSSNVMSTLPQCFTSQRTEGERAREKNSINNSYRTDRSHSNEHNEGERQFNVFFFLQ